MKRVTPLKLAIVQSGRPQKEIAAEVAGLLGWPTASAESRLSRIVNGLHADDATCGAIAQVVGRTKADLWPEQETKAAA